MSAKTSKRTQTTVSEPTIHDEGREFSAKGEPRRGFHRQTYRFADDLIAKGKLAPGGLETSIVIVLQRYTWGAENKPEYFHVSNAKLAKLCNVARQSIDEPLKRLAAVGILTSIPGDERAPAASAGRCRGYRLTPEHWHAAKPYRATAAQPEKNADPLPPPIATAAFANPKTVLVVLPGKHSRPMPLHLALKGKPEMDCPIRFVGDGDVTMGLAFSPVTTADGIDVFFRRADRVAKDLNFPASNNGHVSGPPDNSTSQVIENKQSRLALMHAYRDLLSPAFLAHLHKPVDNPYLEKLCAATQGAPVERLAAKVAELIKRRTFTSALLLKVAAEDIGQAWAAEGAKGADLESVARGLGIDQATIDNWKEGDWDPLHCARANALRSVLEAAAAAAPTAKGGAA